MREMTPEEHRDMWLKFSKKSRKYWNEAYYHGYGSIKRERLMKMENLCRIISERHLWDWLNYAG